MISTISPEDGLDYYDIPIETRLYRGDTPAYKFYLDDGNKFIFNPGFYFFGTNVQDVEQYGVVFEFKTITSYKLLALDSNESLEKLKATIYDTEICRILDENYGTTTGIRDSISVKDKHLCSFLCQNGYQGYAILKDRSTPTGGIFHHEVMICDPRDGIQFESVVTREQELTRLLNDYKSRQAAPSKKPKREVESLAVSPERIKHSFSFRKSLFDDSSPGSLFGDSPPRSLFSADSPPRGSSSINKTLFGGSKHKKNKKTTNNRKKRKSRKTRKYIK